MKIAFIDHGFHETTRSSSFLSRFLRQHGVVDTFYDHSYNGSGPFDIAPVLYSRYDLIVVFQMSTPAIQLADEMPERVVFVPMYDGSHDLPEHNWRQLKHIRILNFCRAMHERVTDLGLESLYVQYFPEPSQSTSEAQNDLRGFFWQRGSGIDLDVVLKLIGDTAFTSFNLHQAPDPGSAAPIHPTLAQSRALNMSVSRWFADYSDFQRLLERSNVFFASRAIEGIGMSFLEAMARGQCVVAPNRPTMSEYIDHDRSGLLYDLAHPTALNLSNAMRLGAAARAQIETGFLKWRIDLETRLPAYLFTMRTRRKSVKSVTRHVWRYLVSARV